MGILRDIEIQALKPQVTQYHVRDGDGLNLVIKPNGTKLWRLRYRFGGTAKTLSIGKYPVVSLKEAREMAFEGKKLLSQGIDPSSHKKASKAAIIAAKTKPEETVEAISKEWFTKFSSQWVDSHASKIIRRLERDLFPHFKNVEISTVKPTALLAVIRRVENRGALETAHRLLQNCGQIWRYAVATGRAEFDITRDLKGAIPPAKENHLGAITEPNEIGALLRNIDEYSGSGVVRLALKLSALVFVRPSELRQAKWEEFDFENQIWTVPAGRMKSRVKHAVPLSNQSISILNELKIIHESEYLFPSPRSMQRCLSNVALLAAIRRMGYTKEEMTAHGFRAMASTNLEQLGYDSRLIELQLAHADTNEVRAAYKRETHLLQLVEKRKMMQVWADYLDQLRAGARIIQLKAA